MTDETSNDNMRAYADARSSGPDAHGQAAMLLVESLIQGLIARSVITVADAVELVDTAAEVTEALAADAASPLDGKVPRNASRHQPQSRPRPSQIGPIADR